MPGVTAFMIALALLSLESAQRPIVVLVPEAVTPEECQVVERIAAVTALTEGLRLVRTRLAPGEPLEDARARVGADVAIAGAHSTGVDGTSVGVVRPTGAAGSSASFGAGDRVAMHVMSVWPRELPPLDLGASGIANPSALEAACRGDGKKALTDAGDAIGATLRRL
ncbi:hypothetical protein L6R52_35460, partial [Myxococcota bacterium]|nr:hypothetical protein [Myxococcota bacterium]